MGTFKGDIIKAAKGEPIEAIVIGEFGWGGYGEDEPRVPKELTGIVLAWEDACSMLDYDYDTGYGAPSCHAITVWTSERILWVTQYDGSTSFSWAYRNPTDYMPDMPGG